MEHSRRLVRVGYGGTDERLNGKDVVTYHLLNGDLTVVHTPSFHNAEQEERNFQIATGIMGQQGYRAPWGEDSEMRQFRSETESAMSDGAARFRLTPAMCGSQVAQSRRGIFSRLFHRT